MYLFHKVPKEEYSALLRTSDDGKYFNQRIRNNYDFDPIVGAESGNIRFGTKKTPDSKGILAVGYNGDEHTLKVFFRPDKVYVFFDVPWEEYKAFISSKNMGKYYNDNIRDNYRYESLDIPRRDLLSALKNLF